MPRMKIGWARRGTVTPPAFQQFRSKVLLDQIDQPWDTIQSKLPGFPGSLIAQTIILKGSIILSQAVVVLAQAEIRADLFLGGQLRMFEQLAQSIGLVFRDLFGIEREQRVISQCVLRMVLDNFATAAAASENSPWLFRAAARFMRKSG